MDGGELGMDDVLTMWLPGVGNSGNGATYASARTPGRLGATIGRPTARSLQMLKPSADSTMTLCADCSRGPRGASGHPYLLAYRVGAETIFKCRGCRTLWSRTTRRLAEYSWTVET